MNENEKLLSFIVPVYNAEKFLEECLYSLVTQNIPRDEYEIICINDGSTDKSQEILDLYAEKYTNVIVVRKENGGVSSARNCGMDLAKGKYIWFVDADDFIKYNCLQELKATMSSNYDIINFGAYQFYERLTEAEQALFNKNRIEVNLTYWGYPFLHLFKTNSLRDNDIVFLKNIKYGEDEIFYNDVSECSEKIVTLNTVYYFYRNNSLSVMSGLSKYENRVKRIDDVITSITILKRNLETGKQKKDFAKSFLLARYKLLDHFLCSLNLADAFIFLGKLQDEKIFDFKDFLEPNIPTRRTIIFNYLKRRPLFLLKTIMEKTFPDSLASSIKNLYYKDKKH